MEGEHGYLDGEPQEERPEDPLLHAQRHGDLHQVRNLERIEAELLKMLEVERQNAQQHQHRPGQRVEKELNGGVQLPRPAPHPDDEVHGDQHQLPENVEQEEIEGNENPDHARLQDQEHGVVFFYAVLNRVPGREAAAEVIEEVVEAVVAGKFFENFF